MSLERVEVLLKIHMCSMSRMEKLCPGNKSRLSFEDHVLEIES